MLSSSTEFREIFQFVPEWEVLLRNFDLDKNADKRLSVSDFLARVGAKAIFTKALKMLDEREKFVRFLRDNYYQPILQKMLNSNQNLRRFLSQRFISVDEQKSHSISLSIEISQKLESVLVKHLSTNTEDGFKVLLPAYVQRTVHNAVIDFIRLESTWEKNTLQDIYLDPEQDDPRTSVADDIAVTPENQILSGEQVSQLNKLREHLKIMLNEPTASKEALTVVDCMFGLGLTNSSIVGEELTMREVCEKLNITGETMPRRIARCQVLLDKGLDLVRQSIYKKLPDIVECWQRGLNLNIASRRELTQQIGMTEGEIERLIKGRQFNELKELVETGVIKESRFSEIKAKGATVMFVPLEINTATTRDIIDILGLSKELAQKLVSERPFKTINELVQKGFLKESELESLIKRGGIIKYKSQNSKRLDLNRCLVEELVSNGQDKEFASFLVKYRPFLTWAELEECIVSSANNREDWVSQISQIRQKFFLGNFSNSG